MKLWHKNLIELATTVITWWLGGWQVALAFFAGMQLEALVLMWSSAQQEKLP